jgi:hypothetical protein
MASIAGLGVALAEFEANDSEAKERQPAIPAGTTLDALELRRMEVLHDLDDLARERDDARAALALVEAEIRARSSRRPAEELLSERTLHVLANVVLPGPVVLAACGIHDGERPPTPENVLRAIATLLRLRLDDQADQGIDGLAVGALAIGYRFGRYVLAGGSLPDPTTDLVHAATAVQTIDGASLVGALHPTTRASLQAFARVCASTDSDTAPPSRVASVLAAMGEGLALAAAQFDRV